METGKHMLILPFRALRKWLNLLTREEGGLGDP